LVGVLSGVLATATGMNGPPLVAVFLSMGLTPPESAPASPCASRPRPLSLGGFAAAGAVGLAAVPLGWWLSNRVFRRVDTAGFRCAVLIMLIGRRESSRRIRTASIFCVYCLSEAPGDRMSMIIKCRSLAYSFSARSWGVIHRKGLREEAELAPG
jgi:hypothetical protein